MAAVSAGEALSLVFRIATLGLSLASAITTVASTQCVYSGNGGSSTTVSYSDYGSFRYAAAADLLSAVLQGVTIYLEATQKKKAAKTVELVDKLVQALTATSAALLLAVDDITSCGRPPRSQGGRQRGGFCGEQAGAFCGRVRFSAAFSFAAVASVSVSVYTRHVPVDVELPPKAPPAPDVRLRRAPTTPPEPKIEPAPPSPPEPKIEPAPPSPPSPPSPPEPKIEPAPPAPDVTQVTTPPPWCRCLTSTTECACVYPGLCLVVCEDPEHSWAACEIPEQFRAAQRMPVARRFGLLVEAMPVTRNAEQPRVPRHDRGE